MSEALPNAAEKHEALKAEANRVLSDFDRTFSQDKLQSEFDIAQRGKIGGARRALQRIQSMRSDNEYDADFVKNAIDTLKSFMKPEVDKESVKRKSADVLGKIKKTEFYKELYDLVTKGEANSYQRKLFTACAQLQNAENIQDESGVKTIQKAIELIETLLAELHRDEMRRATQKDNEERQRAFEAMENYTEDEEEFPFKIRKPDDLILAFEQATNGEVPHSIPKKCVIRTIPSRDRSARINFPDGDYMEIREKMDIPVIRAYPSKDRNNQNSSYEVAIPADLYRKTMTYKQYSSDEPVKGTIWNENVYGGKRAELLQRFTIHDVRECISLLGRVNIFLKRRLNERLNKEDSDYGDWESLTESVRNRVGELMGFKTGEMLYHGDVHLEGNAWYHFYGKDTIRGMTNDAMQGYIEDIEKRITELQKGINNKKETDTIFVDIDGQIK